MNTEETKIYMPKRLVPLCKTIEVLYINLNREPKELKEEILKDIEEDVYSLSGRGTFKKEDFKGIQDMAQDKRFLFIKEIQKSLIKILEKELKECKES